MNVGLTTAILPAGEAAVADAARCLRQGGLVAFPTETVYGLGADASNAAAIARLYEAKGRPAFNPLIAHVSDLGGARRIATVSRPAVASSATGQSAVLGSTRVKGPGQNACASAVACALKRASRRAAARSPTWAISGLNAGRPLAW